MEIKPPLEIDYENRNSGRFSRKIEFAIEQHPSLLKVILQKFLKNKQN